MPDTLNPSIEPNTKQEKKKSSWRSIFKPYRQESYNKILADAYEKEQAKSDDGASNMPGLTDGDKAKALAAQRRAENKDSRSRREADRAIAAGVGVNFAAGSGSYGVA